MSNYLPVLLVSVGANAVPDDSSLSTLPRGQVDYLSHDWQEEDVWRSWRKMTRQKNEIANGMRLENASWRTWWKQRNKLKTVTPETLNWLKDSDVTWLYGPLHTAVDWSPPPRPKPDQTEHQPASTQDRLDLSIPKQKSILKYRSISEMLTSDLPSPLFSPDDSENESEDKSRPLFSNGDREDRNGSQQASSPKRPYLLHTKSDTHISRWGPNRSFRKDSPPRVEPPGSIVSSGDATSPAGEATRLASSHVDSASDFSQHLTAQGEQSSSSSTTPSPRGTLNELGTQPSSLSQGSASSKKKHITFNTFVEQCIAIDKPKDTGFVGGSHHGTDWHDREDDSAFVDDDGYDEDGEDGFDADWGLDECAIGTDSDSEFDEDIFIQDEDDDEDDGIIQMRSRSSSNSKPKPKTPRSNSKVSTSSSSSASTTTSSGDSYSSSASTSGPSGQSSSPARKTIPSSIRRRRRSDGPNHISLPRRGSSSHGLFRPSSSNLLSGSSGHSSSDKDSQQPQQPVHVSIAPIAPTMLKIGGNTSWDGFGVHSHHHHRGSSGAWMEGFGDEGYSDDGGAGPGGARLYFGGKSGSDSDGVGTPLELVYMPPSGRYGGSGNARPGRSNSNTSLNGEEAEVELRENVNERSSTADPRENGEEESMEETDENGDKVYRHQGAYFSTEPTQEGVIGPHTPTVPIVVRTPPAIDQGRGSDSENEAEEDAYDYFGGPDLGEDFATRKTRSSARRKSSNGTPGNIRTDGTSLQRGTSSPSFNGIGERDQGMGGAGPRQSRSRSRSRSRTPSPSFVPASTTSAITVPGRTTSPSEQGVSSPQLSSSSSLLSPPTRGRVPSIAEPQQTASTSRGRSSTRSSTSASDREHSRSNQSSPIGSLSPDGSSIGIAIGAYANGRGGGDREKERERTSRGGERGRERTERRLSHSVSPDAVESVTAVQGRVASSSASTCSSTSSTRTLMPRVGADASAVDEACLSRIAIPNDVRNAEEEARSLHPTPANSPTISMRGAAQAIARMNNRPPISIPDPHLSSPRLSFSSPSADAPPSSPASSTSPSSPKDILCHGRTSSGSLQSNKRSSKDGVDETIISKAAGIVSSAGAYLGWWNNNGASA